VREQVSALGGKDLTDSVPCGETMACPIKLSSATHHVAKSRRIGNELAARTLAEEDED
jgi:hypothetical protein